MKKIVLTVAVWMLATCLPAPTIVLKISPSGNGSVQVVTSGLVGSDTHGIKVVLQSTSDFVRWTSISTNTLPYPFSGSITNVVQTTNSVMFYRVCIPNP